MTIIFLYYQSDGLGPYPIDATKKINNSLRNFS